MADLPQLPGITVTGVSPVPYDYTAALWYQLQLNEYLARQGATSHDPYVPPGGYGAPASKPPPAPPTESGDALELTWDEESGKYVPPTWAMNDQEYADYLGGGDTAYEQMWEERHPGEDVEEMAPGALLRPAPLEPAFDVRNLTPEPTLQQIRPPELKPPGPPRWFLPSLLGVLEYLPLLFPFIPQRTGPRELDEAPRLPPRLPPGAPPFFDPIMPPNWNDIAYEPREFEIGTPAPGPVPFGDLLRPGIPIGDPVGLPDDTIRNPDGTPFSPTVRPLPGDRPRPIADFPLPDAFPITNLAPFPNPGFKPGIPRVFKGTPTPRVANPTKRPPVRIDYDIDLPGWNEPVIRNPRDVARPLPPPFALPGNPLQPDVPLQPFAPLSPPPNRADPCNCSQVKDKKRKKQQPRTVCYEGKFREYARGTSKFSRKRVPCESQNVRPARRKKTPSMSDLARDVFGLTPFGSI